MRFLLICIWRPAISLAVGEGFRQRNGISLDRLKVLLTSAPEQMVLSCTFQCYLPQSKHRSSLVCLLGSCHCNGLQALPHPTSVRAGVVRVDLSPILPVIHGFWLGYVRTVTVGTTFLNALIDKASDSCGPQCNRMNPRTYSSVCQQNSPVVQHLLHLTIFFMDRVTGASCFNTVLDD